MPSIPCLLPSQSGRLSPSSLKWLIPMRLMMSQGPGLKLSALTLATRQTPSCMAAFLYRFHFNHQTNFYYSHFTKQEVCFNGNKKNVVDIYRFYNDCSYFQPCPGVWARGAGAGGGTDRFRNNSLDAHVNSAGASHGAWFSAFLWRDGS